MPFLRRLTFVRCSKPIARRCPPRWTLVASLALLARSEIATTIPFRSSL
jgi:hypothetical protein